MTEKKPIRKDRVLLALLVLVAVILIPILLSSGGSKPSSQTTVATTQSAETTPVPIDVTPLTEPPSGDEATTPSIDGLPDEDVSDETPEEQVTSTSPAILTHVVAAGETLNQIASQMGVTPEQIMADNNLVSTSTITTGETLYASSDGLVHVIKSGQTLTDISITYGVPVDRIAQVNGITDPGRIFAEQRILIPGATTSLWQAVIRLSHGQQVRFIWPLAGDITSPFGWRVHPVLGMRHHHNGIDIDVPIGTMVRAAAPGNVSFIGEDDGYGTMVILKHADGYLTIYGHLSSILVANGQFVEVGQPIAESGNTGLSTGPHLHFEIRNGEFPVDPQRYLPS